MKTKTLLSLFVCGALFSALFSCSDDDKNDNTNCETFSSADSVCYCTAHPDDFPCTTFSFVIDSYTEETVTLTPHPSNGTLWCKGFAIGNDIYLIDRQSASPHAFWQYDLTADHPWTAKANFPGNQYGLTGAAKGKGYASSYASNKFWEYNPSTNEWKPLADLPFSPAEQHWIEYKGKFYVPSHDGIYEFTPDTKEWTKFSNQESSGFGATFLIGDDMYWYNINDSQMSRFNLSTKTYQLHDLPETFGSSIVFNSPFVLDNVAYIVESNQLWIFNHQSHTWTTDDDAIESGRAYPDDVFVVDGKAYLIDDGELKIFTPEN